MAYLSDIEIAQSTQMKHIREIAKVAGVDEKYLEQYGVEDPRVLESFDTTGNGHLAVRINYLKNNEPYSYFWNFATGNKSWKHGTNVYYTSEKAVHGLTRSLNSHGRYYDTTTHEYLGDYLRFLRDYHNINLMSMYNCFNDKLYNNVYFNFDLPGGKEATFDAQAPNYKIYALPVKLFSEYTIAIDCSQGIELFCGLYNTSLDISEKATKLAAKTYLKVNKTLFNQPFLYNKLTVNNWPASDDLTNGGVRTDIYTRWDLTAREKDLKLFIKVPTSCKSSITILEGDYRSFNDTKYANVEFDYEHSASAVTTWTYDEVLKTFKTTVNNESYVLSVNADDTRCLKLLKTTTNPACVRFMANPAIIDEDKKLIINATKPEAPVVVEAGDKVTYYLVITSTGDTTAKNVVVTDKIPEGLKLIKGGITKGGKGNHQGTAHCKRRGCNQRGITQIVMHESIGSSTEIHSRQLKDSIRPTHRASLGESSVHSVRSPALQPASGDPQPALC